MVPIQYSDELMEGAVETEIRRRQEAGDNSLFVHFHRLSDNAYSIYLSPSERAEAIKGVYRFLFSMLKLDSLAPQSLENFPQLKQNSAGAFFIRPEDVSSEECGDILRRDGKAFVVIKVKPETILSPERFQKLLNFEFIHLQDMLDPSFQFTHADSQRSRYWLDPVRLRYRLLWDIYCVARLERMRLDSPRTRAELQLEFDRLYGAIPAQVRTRLFGKVWATESFSHPVLAGLAQVSANLLEFFGERLPEGVCDFVQGSPCPLCNFPTFNWKKTDENPPRMICERCHEHYELKKEAHSWS